MPRRDSSTRSWLVTLGATAVTTYALDATATAGGAALAASRLLRGLDRGWLLALLAASYLLWAAGMRVNLTANGKLLERTGTSTNVVSKAAFHLVASRGGEHPRTLDEVGRTFNVTRERIRQIENQSLKKLQSLSLIHI